MIKYACGCMCTQVCVCISLSVLQHHHIHPTGAECRKEKMIRKEREGERLKDEARAVNISPWQHTYMHPCVHVHQHTSQMNMQYILLIIQRSVCLLQFFHLFVLFYGFSPKLQYLFYVRCFYKTLEVFLFASDFTMSSLSPRGLYFFKNSVFFLNLITNTYTIYRNK